MNRSICFWFGFAIGVALGAILRVLTAHRKVVTRYDAVDAKRGPVHVVVVSNRITGRMNRRVYARDHPND